MANAANRMTSVQGLNRVLFSLVASVLLAFSSLALAADGMTEEVTKGAEAAEQTRQADARAEATINALKEPLYSAFTERYLLDEVKNLRQIVADTRVELIEKTTDRELQIADRAMMYSTDTVTYFFYLIAGVSTLLVLVGWKSLQDIKEGVAAYANQEINRITASYEKRLDALERELNSKSRTIAAAQEEIELTNEIHSLWLKASQEASPQSKIAIYDQILALRSDDVEAMTYKADAALLLGQTQWAMALANKALEIDPDNSHAFYQRACAAAENGQFDKALEDLAQAIYRSDSLKGQAALDQSFVSLYEHEDFRELIGGIADTEPS